MGFLEHLDELRKRLIWCCVGVAAGMLVAFFFVGRIVDFVLEPTYRMLPAGSELVFIRPGEAFSFEMSVAFVAGMVLAAPSVMYQVWLFVAPGLYVVPGDAGLLRNVQRPRMKFMPRLDDTIDLCMKMMLGMVVVFQIPTVVFFLSRLGLVTARFLWRNIKYAVLIIFIVAAVLTPSTDPWNQIAFAMPMIALYLFSIAIAWFVRPKQEPKRGESGRLRLVFAATVIDQAYRNRRRATEGRFRKPARGRLTRA